MFDFNNQTFKSKRFKSYYSYLYTSISISMLSEAINCFRKSGYGVLPNFLSAEQCTKAIG